MKDFVKWFQIALWIITRFRLFAKHSIKKPCRKWQK